MNKKELLNGKIRTEKFYLRFFISDFNWKSSMVNGHLLNQIRKLLWRSLYVHSQNWNWLSGFTNKCPMPLSFFIISSKLWLKLFASKKNFNSDLWKILCLAFVINVTISVHSLAKLNGLAGFFGLVIFSGPQCIVDFKIASTSRACFTANSMRALASVMRISASNWRVVTGIEPILAYATICCSHFYIKAFQFLRNISRTR